MIIARRILPALAVIAACSSGDRIDNDFDVSVPQPAYSANGPLVLFDEGHNNWHKAKRSYRPFVDLIEADGYRVERNGNAFQRADLDRVDVLLIANATGTNESNDEPAFSDDEVEIVRAWVNDGGSLLLITDHYPTGHANEKLAASFGIHFSKGQVADSLHFDSTFESTHLVYTRADSTLVSHPITDGASAGERLERVLTLTGQAVHAEPPAVGFLRLAPSARASEPRPTVERRGSDVLVSVAYENPVPVPGWSQGLAFEYGRGRVVVLGEAGMLTARFSGYDGRPIGMNTPGYDNRQLALNIMHWLTRKL